MPYDEEKVSKMWGEIHRIERKIDEMIVEELVRRVRDSHPLARQVELVQEDAFWFVSGVSNDAPGLDDPTFYRDDRLEEMCDGSGYDELNVLVAELPCDDPEMISRWITVR